MALSVLGAGFGRTGTLSLKKSLEQLEFGPCYHMLEVRHNDGHSDLWRALVMSGDHQWDHLFEHFRAAVDWPACAFWRELCDYYPTAKVILTVRDPDEWYRSISKTIFTLLQQPIDEADIVSQRRREWIRELILERTFQSRLDDKDHVIGVYEQHINAVRKTIAPERLLQFDVASGWPPLCEFLQCEVPDSPFPSTNSRAEFHERITARETEK